MYCARYKKKGDHKKIASDVLNQVGIIDELQNIVCAKLSDGEQQRVAIARILAQDGNIIFADEPTGNLDDKTSKDIIFLLKRLTTLDNKCVICVTHSKEVIKKADVVFHLENGELNKLPI